MPRAFTEAERVRIEHALKQAAREALLGSGLRRTPIDALTRAAGISKGSFYLLFPSKEALAVAVLKDAETTLRAELDAAAEGPEPLRAVLEHVFASVATHPMLALLRDPEELAWLTRSLPAGALDAELADDAAWFGGLIERLRARGVRVDLTGEELAGIGGVALAIEQGRGLLGPARDAVVRRIVDGLLAVSG